MRCPRCVQNFYQAAPSCPHCGFTMADADEAFGKEPVALKKLTDTAGILRMKDREVLRNELKRFERKFPQLFFGIYAEAFDNVSSLRQYGFWLLNHAAFDDVDIERPNECGILLVVDVNSKSLGMTYGYSLLPYLDEESAFEILSFAHAPLLESQYADAFKIIIRKTVAHLKKKYREVRRDPEFVLGECGQRLRKVDDAPKPIRNRASKKSLSKVAVRKEDSK